MQISNPTVRYTDRICKGMWNITFTVLSNIYIYICSVEGCLHWLAATHIGDNIGCDKFENWHPIILLEEHLRSIRFCLAGCLHHQAQAKAVTGSYVTTTLFHLVTRYVYVCNARLEYFTTQGVDSQAIRPQVFRL